MEYKQHNNTSYKNKMYNEIKIKDIPEEKLKKAIHDIIFIIYNDFGQEYSDQDINYILIRIVPELVKNNKNLLWGEFRHIVNMGIKGKWGTTGKFCLRSLLIWIDKYKQEERDRQRKLEMENNKKLKKGENWNPDGQYHAKAILLCMKHPLLRKIEHQQRANLIKEGKSLEEILNIAKNAK